MKQTACRLSVLACPTHTSMSDDRTMSRPGSEVFLPRGSQGFLPDFLRAGAVIALLLVSLMTAFSNTVVKLGAVTQISGPADLDLAGDFAYAINFSTDDPVRTVHGVAFQPDRLKITGATLTGPQQVTPWQTRPEFGSIPVEVRRPEVNMRVFVDHAASIERDAWWRARLERCFALLQP